MFDAGAPDHWSGGVVEVPSQVNRTGMLPPLVMALLVSEKPLVLVELAGVAVVVVTGRFSVGEFRCWVMPVTYELDLKPHWKSENPFRQHPQRSLRLGS